MDRETGKEWHVWRDRTECEGMNYEQILSLLIEEAGRDGFYPCDLNWKGKPNIYLRGTFEFDAEDVELAKPRFLKDGFLMFVKKKEDDARPIPNH